VGVKRTYETYLWDQTLVLRFVNAATHSFSETEHSHLGLFPYGAPSRSSSSRDSAEPRRGTAAPPSTPPGVRPVHFAYVTVFVKGRT
jgi:hypothetical protein